MESRGGGQGAGRPGVHACRLLWGGVEELVRVAAVIPRRARALAEYDTAEAGGAALRRRAVHQADVILAAKGLAGRSPAQALPLRAAAAAVDAP